MCDTLVALGNSTKNGRVIFGKNSDRPYDEAQLITYVPHKNFSVNGQLKCTYITIPQVTETAAIILSQPYWMWGAEMGANEYGVVIGNEAVHSKEPLRSKGLLGMDLLRLGLERGRTALDSLKVITELLEKYGQGGNCSIGGDGWMYHNSFLIADPKDAFVLETADKWWIAEKVKDVRSISNNLSIRGKGDFRREGIIQHAIKKGYCKEEKDFDFALTFSDEPIPDKFSPYSRPGKSIQLLTRNKGDIKSSLMMEFLREHEVGICMHGYYDSTGSQVSAISEDFNKSIHWFTGSTRPCISIFKPYTFPAEGFKFLKPGPYNKVEMSWFWSKHALIKRADINKLKGIESKLISDVNSVVKQVNVLNNEEFVERIKNINAEAWQKSEEMIK
jgi:secernin